MKVLYVSSRNPFPAKAGRENMISQSLNFINKFHDLDVVYFKSAKERVSHEGFSSLSVRPFVFSLNSYLRIILNFIKGFSFQEALYYSESNGRQLAQIIKERDIDIVVFDMLRTASLYKFVDVPFIVDYDDLLSERYKKMLERGDFSSFIGTYAAKVPNFFTYLARYLGRLVLVFEMRRIAYSEHLLYCVSSVVILTSKLEAEKINAVHKGNKAIGIPPCFNVSLLSFSKDSFDFLFLGNLKTAQNLRSVEYILDCIMPEIIKVYPTSKLHVVGTYNSSDVSRYYENKYVIFHGFVEDVRTVASLCSLAVCPISFGTGIKVKIIELMSMGFPVITNSIGAEGITALDNREILIRDDTSSIVDAVIKLMCDRDCLNFISNNALRYISENHSLKVNSELYDECLRRTYNSFFDEYKH